MYCKNFEELDKNELYAIAKLRQEVFIVEQNSVYLDLDDLDQAAIHYLDYCQTDSLKVYGRYRKPAELDQINIERVVMHPSVRGKGLGKKLMKKMTTDIKIHFLETPIALSSQVEACEFYHSLGFESVGDVYDDGGIEHIKMVLQK